MDNKELADESLSYSETLQSSVTFATLLFTCMVLCGFTLAPVIGWVALVGNIMCATALCAVWASRVPPAAATAVMSLAYVPAAIVCVIDAAWISAAACLLLFCVFAHSAYKHRHLVSARKAREILESEPNDD